MSEVERLQAEVDRLTRELDEANKNILALITALRALYAEAVTG